MKKELYDFQRKALDAIQDRDYVCYELAGDIGETKNANWHFSKFERKVFRLSLEQPGATLEDKV